MARPSLNRVRADVTLHPDTKARLAQVAAERRTTIGQLLDDLVAEHLQPAGRTPRESIAPDEKGTRATSQAPRKIL